MNFSKVLKLWKSSLPIFAGQMMAYQQTLDYLYSQLPMFQRIGAAAFKKDLTNIIKLCDLLGHPYKKFPAIHIAGTNGKGSVTHMLGAILQQHGLKAGLYTSPHLKDFRERIKINGVMIEEQFVVDFVEKYRQHFDDIQPSFFEITVALAFDYFAKQKVDVAVIEVGLGGRFDSTNIITPLLSVITNISYDHQQFLGNTLPEIAFEKAGIIKAGVPAVIGESQPETKNVFIRKAAECNSPLFFADEKFSTGKIHEISLERIVADILENGKTRLEKLVLDLTGNYQFRNIVTVIQAVEVLKSAGYHIRDEEIYQALSQVKKLTRFTGRWQILSRSPLIIADAAHNVAGIELAMKQLQSVPHEKLHIVFGMVKDKEAGEILKLLPAHAAYYFCKPGIPRGLDERELAEKAGKHHLSGNYYLSVKSALNEAKKKAGNHDLIYIGGSMFVIAEIL